MQIDRDAALGARNTLALPARARALVTIESPAAVGAVLSLAAREALPVIPLGEGSNIVLAGDLDALVLRLDSRGIDVLARDAERVRLRVAAGENWHRFVAWTLDAGYFGLENLALIPGTVGAAPIQNIGAYGVELGDRLLAVHGVCLESGDELHLSREACGLGYRDSIFKRAWRDRCLITAVELELELAPRSDVSYPVLAEFLLHRGIDEADPRAVFDAVVALRRGRLPDPARQPNAGSFFKNPVLGAEQAEALRARFPELPAFSQPDGTVKLAAAWMIEQCGWKGHRRGDVGVHVDHALVLVNHGAGDGGQLLALAREIEASVRDTFGIGLVMEPRVYGCAT